MSQYSLSYDSSGNASLAATTTTPTRAATPSKDWKVSDYVSRTQDYGVTETFKDKDTPEEQLKTIQKVLVPDIKTIYDSDNGMSMYAAEKDAFKNTAARDKDGKIIGGLTLAEQAMITAHQIAAMDPFAKTILKATPLRPIISGAEFVAKATTIDYYDTRDPMYNYTGYGAESGGADERIEYAGGINIDGEYTYGTDYQGDDKPSDTNAKNKAYAEVQNQIGRSLHGDGGNNNGGGNPTGSPGSKGPGGSDEMGSF